MSQLQISLLGSIELYLDDKRITRLTSKKAQALLAYLAAESGQSHWRGSLAGLLWPEQPEGLARQSLRQALLQVRRVLRAGSLDATQETVEFVPQPGFQLDVVTF